MSQPLDRTCRLPELGEVDREAGEFWVENPFLMPLQGHNLSAYERNCLFLNLDGESFIDASFASAVDIDSDSRSVIAADFNRDGAPDLLVGSVGGGPVRLFLNRFPKKRHLRLELIGKTSNRSAIGSRVVIQTGGKKIVRDLFAVNGFMGQSPAELLVGLGDAETVDAINIRWPDGKTQQFKKLPVDAHVVIRQGDEKFTIAK